MHQIENNIKKLLEDIPASVDLVAVSKTKPLEELEVAYQSGQRIFGENKIQEMTQKWEKLPKDIEWHMIGHVQTNKVKYMAPYVSLIHGVESLKLIKEIHKQGLKNDRVISCLLQVHIATETTKFGLLPVEVASLMKESLEFDHVRVVGLMGMASFTENKEQIREEFKGLKVLFDELKVSNDNMKILSMGMSNDYPTAIEMGSTMIRVGSLIFGERNY